MKIKKPSKYGPSKNWTLQNLNDWAKEATTSILGLPRGVEAIKLSDLLRSIDTGQDIQYMNRWDNYLLVTCRSVPDPKTGAVGVAPSPQKYADGNLYSATIGSPSLPGNN